MGTQSTSNRTRLSLLDRAKSRDALAWRELVDLYAPLVTHWCRGCGLDSHYTADCIQDVFLSVSNHLTQFRPTGVGGSFRAWLWTITRNKIRDLCRSLKRHTPSAGGSTNQQVLARLIDENEIPVDEPSGEDQIRELTHRGLRQVQGDFEPITWQAFWRSTIDGIATSVVAEELGVSPAAIRQARSRVLRRLREQLGELG